MKYFFRYCKEFQNVRRFSIGAFPRYNVIIFLMQRKASFSEKIVKNLVTKVSPLYRRWMVGHQLCKCSRTLSSYNPFGRAVLC